MSKHKEAAMSFLKMAGMGQVEGVCPGRRALLYPSQPVLQGDRQSLLKAMQEASKTSPNKSIEIKRVYEDGDTVVTHSR